MFFLRVLLIAIGITALGFLHAMALTAATGALIGLIVGFLVSSILLWIWGPTAVLNRAEDH